MSDQNAQPAPATDPVRVLENTRRTLRKLAQNIDAALDAIEASKEPARTSR